MLLSPSGGIIYHWRALWRSNSAWSEYQKDICQWLMSWAPKTSTLILVGPSAGYSLCRDFLTHFNLLICVDPDSLARYLFRLRFKGIKTTWILKAMSPSQLETLLSQYPNAAVLFCNLLGQLHLMHDEKTIHSWKKELPVLLKNRLWASYHDRLSGHATPRLKKLTSPYRLSSEDLAKAFYEPDSQIELTDHDVDDYFDTPLASSYFCWPLLKNQSHVVEALANPAPKSIQAADTKKT